ncbi:hypothetical protein [Salinisphaera sp. G21_0]|uniref:hypothetical protein n=1 Tax=Salinisphaera sp. G21_0 TaxID=2821094 RepID=UPI001ADB2CF3|nr:hypothetical protein [Salinisphaera sp. G21_0]MBO9482394.1 hypothetical protein [Salinisphaera sp. G21_0]
MSGSELVFKACPQQSSMVFGLRVGQTEPRNYFNNLIPCSASLHNPLSDSRFKKVPIRVIYSQSSSVINIHHNPCEVPNPLPNNHHIVDPRFVRAMPVSIINPRTNSEQLQQNIPPARNELHFNALASSLGESPPLSHDKPKRKANAQHGKVSTAKQTQAKPGKELPCTKAKKRKTYVEEAEKRKAYYKAWAQSERGKALKRAWENSEKGKTCRRASRKAYAHSEKGKAYQKAYSQSKERKAYLKAYSQSERAKAARRAYRHSEKGRATQRAWEQSLKRKAYKKAYSQSERGKAAKRAYTQSEKGKATYRARKQFLKMKALQSASHQAFKHTSDQEQEKITGKHATVLSAQTSEATEYK